uniref:Copper transport protein n=1 Tax=Syphacia muris TaxID=451379 RepID=A0A0N5AYL7_9BILA
MDMADMTLHTGTREFVLFKFWKIGSVAGMTGSMVIVMLMCILFEALKALRVFLAKVEVAKRHERMQGLPSHPEASSRIDVSSNDSLTYPPVLGFTGSGKVFTSYRLMQALLYALQASLAYFLMLIVMTFNIWLLIAVVLGEAFGYFLFTGEPLNSDSLQHC